jgi:hypothetical protein
VLGTVIAVVRNVMWSLPSRNSHFTHATRHFTNKNRQEWKGEAVRKAGGCGLRIELLV